MPLQIYNTLSGKKEPFVPFEERFVRMYACGITPYGSSHIGHARCYMVWDTLRRLLAYSGFKVKYVQNFTDIDDKIIARANELETDPLMLSEKYISEYFGEFGKLNVLPADEYPKVTEHIPEIIGIIAKLLEKKFAYGSGGDVFFEVGKFREYGKLSRQSLEELIKGKRVEVNPNKKHPADFALWKAAKEGVPCWDSHFGKGRPGWHIECSAMSMKYLGEQFDLHCGGQDLIFPHHENEIAQSEAATGKKPFAKYWMHNGFVTIRKEKMAKSVGNILPLSEMLGKHSGEAIRFFMLLTHYRQPLDYSDSAVRNAEESLQNLKNALLRVGEITGGEMAGEVENAELMRIENDFMKQLNDDLNTPGAISVLYELRDAAFKAMESFQKSRDGGEEEKLREIQLLFSKFGKVLGIFESDFDGGKGKREGIDADEINKAIEERQKARAAGNFKLADGIRERLRKRGILLEDNPDGTVSWRMLER